jgi:hypothetical protein
MNATIVTGRGRVLDPQHDTRVGRGVETREALQQAYLHLVELGHFRPSLGDLESSAKVPTSTIKNYYPRLPMLGGVVAERVPLLVLRALHLSSLNLSVLTKPDQHALAHALLAGERLNRGVAP